MKIVLLDGWKGNHGRLEPMAKRLRGAGDAGIWRYDTSGHRDLESLGADCADHLESLDAPFQVVAYSMGGLVVREALRQRPHLRLERAVFMHSPHQGTCLAHFVGLPAVRQMRPGSAFLRRLNAQSWEIPALNIWCPGDLIVVPGWHARWAAASAELRCDVPAHIWPIHSRAWHQQIQTFLHAAPSDVMSLTQLNDQRTMPKH
jgi:pimeloyl-ACP methyl ester carboxylesterase